MRIDFSSMRIPYLRTRRLLSNSPVEKQSLTENQSTQAANHVTVQDSLELTTVEHLLTNDNIQKDEENHVIVTELFEDDDIQKDELIFDKIKAEGIVHDYFDGDLKTDELVSDQTKADAAHHAKFASDLKNSTPIQRHQPLTPVSSRSMIDPNSEAFSFAATLLQPHVVTNPVIANVDKNILDAASQGLVPAAVGQNFTLIDNPLATHQKTKHTNKRTKRLKKILRHLLLLIVIELLIAKLLGLF